MNKYDMKHYEANRYDANRYDVAVVGGSAAGLSAALVLTRARRSVVVIDSGTPRNAPATHMHGYLSRDGMNPADLLDAGRDEVKGYGGELLAGVVTELIPNGPQGFWALLSDGRRLSARKVLVATGLHDELPAIAGLADRWARDVLHCPYCHGHEVADRRLGVLGGTPGSVHYAQIVRQWSDDLVYFAAPDTLTAVQRSELLARQIDIVEEPIDGLVVDDDRLVGVRLAGGRVVPRDALFVPPRFVPNNALLVGVGCAVDDAGWPVIDGTGCTSMRGIWAAGNVADPRAQVITAAGAGSAAAISINAELVEDDVRRAVDDFNHGHTR